VSPTVDAFLITIPPLVVYLTVGLVVGIESLGVPLPGEIVLVSAALLSSRHELDVSPGWIALAATTGAVVGDSIGYAIGRRYGMGLFAWAGRKMPRHFGPSHVLAAERLFARWGVLAVFFGRFIALLRIFAGPLAGALLLPALRREDGQASVVRHDVPVCFQRHRALLQHQRGRQAVAGFGVEL